MNPEYAAAHTGAPGIPLSEHGLWKERNAEGLALASGGDWASAVEAFNDALGLVDALTAKDSVTQAAKDNSRAKVLLNLSQAHFHTGALAEARRFAERSLALRVGLFGEDALVVARTRSDLAVILHSLGENEEADSLLDRAISAAERKRGEQAALLVPVLQSAAQLIGGSRSGTDAASFADRLDALEKAIADELIEASNATMPEHSFRNNAFASGSDDHPLRAAIAETASLLRTTPASNVAMNVNLDDAVFDIIEPPPPTLSALPLSPRSSSAANPLGFEVQYGIPRQLHDPIDTDPIDTDPINTSVTMEIPVRGKAQEPELLDLDLSPSMPVAPLTPSHELIDPRQLLAEREAAEPTRYNNRANVRAVGGVRRGSTQVVTPKLLWYILFALGAFSAGVAITLLVLRLRR